MKMLIFTLTSILIATFPCTSNPLNILHKNKLDFKDKFQIHQTIAKRSAILKDTEKLNIRLKRDFSNLVQNSRINFQKPLGNVAGISQRMFNSNGPSISKTDAAEEINKLMERSLLPSADDNLVNDRKLVPLDSSKASALNSASLVSTPSKLNNFNQNLNFGNGQINAINGGPAMTGLQSADNADSNMESTLNGNNANSMPSLINRGDGVSTNLNNEKPNKDKITGSIANSYSPSINKEQGLSINSNEKKGISEGLSISSGSGSGISVANFNKGKPGISNDNLSNSISNGDINAVKDGSNAVVMNNGNEEVSSNNAVAINNGNEAVSMSGSGASFGSGLGKVAGLGLNNFPTNENNGDKDILINSGNNNLSNLNKSNKNAKSGLTDNKTVNTTLLGNSINTKKEKGFSELSNGTNKINSLTKGKGTVAISNVNDGNKNVSQEKGKQASNNGNGATKDKSNNSLSDEPSTSVSVSSNGGSGVASVSSGLPSAALPLLGPVSTKPIGNLIENIGNNIKNNLFSGTGNGNTAISIADNNGGTAAAKNDSSGFVFGVNNGGKKLVELDASPAPGNGALAISNVTGSSPEKEIEKQKTGTSIPGKGMGNGALAVSSGNAEPSNVESEGIPPNTPNIVNSQSNIGKCNCNSVKPKTYTSQDGNIVVKIGKNDLITSITYKDSSSPNHVANGIPNQDPNLPGPSFNKNIPPAKAVTNTPIYSGKNKIGTNNTPNTMATSISSNNGKRNPSDTIASTSINSGSNNAGGVSMSSTSGNDLNSAKALSTGLSLANGNIGLNMGDGGISLSLKDGTGSKNSVNTSNHQIKDEQPNSEDIETSILNDGNSDNNIISTKLNSANKGSFVDSPSNNVPNLQGITFNGNSNLLQIADNNNGFKTYATPDGKTKLMVGNNSIASTSDNPGHGSSSFSFVQGGNGKGVVSNFRGEVNSNFENGTSIENDVDQITSPSFINSPIMDNNFNNQFGNKHQKNFYNSIDNKIVVEIGNDSFIKSASFQELDGPLNARVNTKSVHKNETSQPNEKIFKNRNGKMTVVIENDDFIKFLYFFETGNVNNNNMDQNTENKEDITHNNKPNGEGGSVNNKHKNGGLSGLGEGKIPFNIGNNGMGRNVIDSNNSNNNGIGNLAIANSDDGNESMTPSNTIGESKNQSSKINQNKGNYGKTIKSFNNVNNYVNNHDKSLKNNNNINNNLNKNNNINNNLNKNNNNDNSHNNNVNNHNNFDGSGFVNLNNGGSPSNETGTALNAANGNSVTSVTNGGENRPKKADTTNVSTSTSASNGGSGILASNAGVGLAPSGVGSGMAFSSVSNDGVSVAGAGGGIAATNNNRLSKSGNAISINSGGGSGVAMNSGTGNSVSSVASSMGDGFKGSGVVSSAVTGAAATDLGSDISISNIGENMNLKVGENSKQLKGKGDGPKVEIAGGRVNLQL